MGGSVNFPVDREGFSTTNAVAEFLNAFTFPSIVPLATDMAALADLSELPVPVLVSAGGADVPGDVPGSRLEGVRDIMDSTATTLSAVGRHENQTAAMKAVLVERMLSAVEAEEAVLDLDLWQRETSRIGLRAEVAVMMSIPEGTATALIVDSAALVRYLPATMAQLWAGVLGWGYAVIIAEETTLLRQAHLPQEVINAFEQLLLGKAEHATLHSFREKARRVRERSYPETLAPRTRKAYENRRIGVSRARDGMSWLNLYGPSPTVEAIWIQCTQSAQAAQGPHEGRTLTQLRADIAAALLLGQTLDQNGIHAPAPASEGSTDTTATSSNTSSSTSTAASTGSSTGGAGVTADPGQGIWFSRVEEEPDPCQGGCFPDPDTLGPYFYSWQLPVFDDPDYKDPAFREPDPRNQPDWQVPGQPPKLTATANNTSSTPGTGGNGAAGPEPSPEGTIVSGPGGMTLSRAVTAAGGAWPPLPQVTPILLVPALSLLGFTDEPAWMSGMGPISIEVAKYLTANSSSFYRVLVDPISNQPLDAAPDVHRVTQALKTRLLMRDEYCVFPGCNARAVNCEADHLQAFATGGPTTYGNLESLCRFHHRLKHHKDDKTRTGGVRTEQSFERQSVHPRGWTPRMSEHGVEWTTPTGYICPPEEPDTQPPVYPEALKILIEAMLQAHQQRQDRIPAQDTAQGGTGGRDREVLPEDCPCELCQGLCDAPGFYQGEDPDPEAHPDWISEDDMDPQDPRWESYTWDPDKLPEPPAQSKADEEILDRISIENYLHRHPKAL